MEVKMVRSRNRQGLIELLNKTAARIQKGGNYQWTHQEVVIVDISLRR